MHIGGFLCCGNRFKQLRILAHKVPDPHAGRRRFGEAAEQNAVVKPACGDVGQRFAVKAQLAVGIILNQDDIFIPNDMIYGFAVLDGVGKAGGILEVRHGIDEFHLRRRKRGGKALNIQPVLAECDGMERGRILQEGLGDRYNQKINTMYCTKEAIASVLPQTDMVINCVKWPKQRKDFLIDKEMLKLMEPGSVLVDISNDDPGAIESSHETHHDNPRYVVNGVVHYCVSNISGAVAYSTSVALAGDTLPLLLNILNNGLTEACVRDGFIRRSLTAYKGLLTHEETSGIQGRPWIRPEDVLGIAERKLDPAPPATTTRSTNFITCCK